MRIRRRGLFRVILATFCTANLRTLDFCTANLRTLDKSVRYTTFADTSPHPYARSLEEVFGSTIA